MKNYKFGLIAEYFIIFYYIICFYKILHHRYKTKVGEIDVIMLRRRELVFIEVKARQKGMHENIISIGQQKRLIRAAEFFITKHKNYSNYNLRFDLALVRPYRLPIIIKKAW